MGRTRTKAFLALFGDLAGSREVSDRAGLHRQLKRSLKLITERKAFAQVRAGGPEITAGDEFQVLLHADPRHSPGAAAMSFFRELSEDLPVKCAFGVGLGTLSMALKAPIRELDGSCFHRAREALQRAKHEDRWVVIAGIPDENAKTANAILRLTGSIRESWTERQKEIIRIRRKTPLQKDVARKLKVFPSVISEALSAARHDAVLEAEDVVAALLDRVVQEGVADQRNGDE